MTYAMARMENDDEKVEDTYLSIDKYERLVDGLFHKCEQWLLGKVASDRIVAVFNSVNDKQYRIAELNGKPDDYDWESVPEEIFDRAEQVEGRCADRMMNAVGKAVAQLQSEGDETIIRRAYYFGIYSQECYFNPLPCC